MRDYMMLQGGVWLYTIMPDGSEEPHTVKARQDDLRVPEPMAQEKSEGETDA